MTIKSLSIVFVMVCAGFIASAQSQTTENLQKQHKGALSLFFYQNTLRMINQTGDPAFDELIKDIEKMKFLMINKTTDNFDPGQYKKLVAEYKSEKFEEIMTSRFEGKNFDIFLKGSDKKTDGMLVLVNDSETLFVLDILGRINVNKVTELYNKLDESSDIGQQIKNFTERGKNRKKEVVESDH
jgi:hypothetical protein